MKALVRAAQAAGVRDPRVLSALGSVDRRRHLPVDQRSRAEEDVPLPIGCGQTTSQPSLVALMVEAIDLQAGDRVLEVGTGTGYQAAVLSRLVTEAWTVERWSELATSAAEALSDRQNAHVVRGDATLGLAEHAPFDAIVVGCAAPEVPAAWVAQLVEGGRLVVPVGPGGEEQVRVLTKLDGRLDAGRLLVPARFVPLVPGVP